MTAVGTGRASTGADARPGAAAVAVRGLAAGYGCPAADGPGAAAAVLESVDLELQPGECLAVVGRSGCGKTTLLTALAGLLTPLAGEVLVDGVVVAAADGAGSTVPGCRAGHAAYMFQDDLLLPWKTVLGNAVFAAQVAPGAASGLEERAAVLLEEVGLGAALDALPRELSGGMRQRVALARTLMLGRGLVLLDEPFGSLDALTRSEVRLWLLRAMVAHPVTWVLVTHDVSEAVLLGDQVAALRGRPAHLEPPSPVPLDRAARLRIAAAEADGVEPLADVASARAALFEAAARLRAALGSRDESEATSGPTGRRRER